MLVNKLVEDFFFLLKLDFSSHQNTERRHRSGLSDRKRKEASEDDDN